MQLIYTEWCVHAVLYFCGQIGVFGSGFGEQIKQSGRYDVLWSISVYCSITDLIHIIVT